MGEKYFSKQTFDFLSELTDNNDRAWFEANKKRYEDFVRTPALDFIEAMSHHMPAISRHFLAQPKKVGGSLMRVYRDTRFSGDKTPYKTNIGIQFRHEIGKDVHAPGYYLHIEPHQCFFAAGVWHPDADALFRIRTFMVEKSEKWQPVLQDKAFNKFFALDGDSLSRVPRGFAKEHPLAEDLKRKDFICLAALGRKEVVSGNLLELAVERYRQAAPLMKFLCDALELRF